MIRWVQFDSVTIDLSDITNECIRKKYLNFIDTIDTIYLRSSILPLNVIFCFFTDTNLFDRFFKLPQLVWLAIVCAQRGMIRLPVSAVSMRIKFRGLGFF